MQTCRRELLDRTLIWNQQHCCTPCEFEQFYNSHRPHQGIANARPLPHCPHRSPSRPPPPASTSADATVSTPSSTSTGMPLNLHG